MRAPLPANEPERLAAVQSYGALDTLPEVSFDRITRAASRVFRAPICLITLVDTERQFFKSRLGTDLPQTHRDWAFCAHAIAEDSTLVVCNAATDQRFADNPLVTGVPYIRFYAGAPLRNPQNLVLGTLCVIDSVPRHYPEPEQIEVLEDLAAQVVELLEAGKRGRELSGLKCDLEGLHHELDASRERWLRTQRAAALALDAGRMGFWEWDGRTDRTEWSERMFQIMGLDWAEQPPAFEELIRRVHPEDTAAFRQAFLPQEFRHERFEVKFRLRSEDGQERQISTAGSARASGAQGVDGAFGVIWDTTNEHRKERALMESEELFRGLSSSCAVGIFKTDPQGHTIYVNERLTDIFDRPAEDLLGSGWQRFLHPEDASFVLQSQTLETWTAFEKEYRILRPDGSIRWLFGRTEAIHGENGIAGVVGTIDDITERKKTLDELIAAKEAAEVANRSKNLFLSNVSHEIRTPLNGVMGMTDLLLMSDLNGDQQQMAQIISDSGSALLKVVDDILDLSRIEAGKLVIEDKPFNLQTLLRQSFNANLPEAKEKGLLLESKVPDGIPEAYRGDLNRIKQILTIFISNGLKFTVVGGVTVIVSAEPLSATTHEVLFQVRDTGPGIAVEDQGKLFQPFSQLDNTNTRKHGGIGLGLAIALRLAELMGGTVGVISAPQQGATFWLKLPIAHQDGLESVNPPVSNFRSGEDRGHILVVEDNAVNREVLTGVLKKLGWTWDIALNGASAVHLAQTNRYALVLMDCQMPELDGYEATRQIRAFERESGRRPVPIIALTAHAMTGDRARCLDAGMSDYLSKPIRWDELRSALDRWFDNTRKATTTDFLVPGMLA